MPLVKMERVKFATDMSMATITRASSSSFRVALAELLQQVAAGVIASDATIRDSVIAAAEGVLSEMAGHYLPKDEAPAERYAVTFEDENRRIFGGVYGDGSVEFLKLVLPEDTGGGGGISITSSDVTATKSDRAKFLTAGDSLTRGFGPSGTWPEGSSWPRILEGKLSGSSVNLRAVSGFTIDEVAIYVGALGVQPPAGTVIPTSGPVTFTIQNAIGFRPDTARSFSGALAGVAGSLDVAASGTSATFTRSDAGNAVTTAASDSFKVGTSSWAWSVLILGAGRNDVATGTTGAHATVEDHVVERTKTIVQWLAPRAPRFIVWGVPRSRSERPGTAARTTVDNINNRIRALYPGAWVDVNAWLTGSALAATGTSATATDLQDVADGVPPNSLMYDSIHWNEATAAALADFMYEQASLREYRVGQ